MDVAEKFYGGYGEKVTGKQGQIHAQGNAYLKKEWPELDYIEKVSIIKEGEKVDPSKVDGKDGKPSSSTSTGAPDEKGSNTSTYVIVGLLAAGALLAFMFMRGQGDEEEEERPRPRKKRSAASTKKRAKKKASAKKSSASSGTKKKKKRRKKKRKKKTSDSE
jgi:hypothetical protein